MAIALLLAITLGLCLHYLHESRELAIGNVIMSEGGLEEQGEDRF